MRGRLIGLASFSHCCYNFVYEDCCAPGDEKKLRIGG